MNYLPFATGQRKLGCDHSLDNTHQQQAVLRKIPMLVHLLLLTAIKLKAIQIKQATNSNNLMLV